MKTEIDSRRLLNGAEEAVINPSLVMRIGRRRWRRWIGSGLAIFAAVSAAALFSYPQTYSATVSISMQQPNQAPSALLALTGSTAKKYTGVLKSRSFAERVDKSVHFRELMGLRPTEKAQDEAIEKVIKDLRVDDNAVDGLLYITVNLTGPARLAPDPGGTKRAQLRAGVARAANLYADALRNYLINTDTEKETVLLRSADVQVAQARKSYTDSIDNLAAFIRSTRMLAIPTGGSGSGSSSEVGGSASQVASLYNRRAELETKIKSTDTLLGSTKRLLTNPKQDLTALPEEDPLLVIARREVNDAQANLDNLHIQFGSSMQSVRRAEERLKLAQNNLHAEVATILRGNTSENLKRQALQTEYDTLERQIRAAESNFQNNRNMTVELEKRRNEVMLKLETLKTILTRYAELKLQTVSAQNRMAVIDPAREPSFSTPGIALMLAVGILAGLVFVAFWWAVEYLLAFQRSASQPTIVRE